MEKVLLRPKCSTLRPTPLVRPQAPSSSHRFDKGRGYVATVLCSERNTRVGDIVLAGSNYGKVKAMFNERNQRVKEAGPATPVLILGLNGAPQAGDTFNVMPTEQEAREIANKREQLQRELGLRTNKRIGLEEIGRRRAIGNFHELNIIVKGDVDGSIEALSDSLIKLSTEEVKVNVLHKAVGAISESDVALAAASDAPIIGFQVRPSQAARRAAERDGVEIRLYSVIYQGYRRGEGCHGRHARPRNQGRGYRHGRSASGIQDFQSRHYSRRYCTRRKNQTLLQSAPDSRRYRAIHRRTPARSSASKTMSRRCSAATTAASQLPDTTTSRKATSLRHSRKSKSRKPSDKSN